MKILNDISLPAKTLGRHPKIAQICFKSSLRASRDLQSFGLA